jgi:sulfite reductase alpha subunit-like flavoprotein
VASLRRVEAGPAEEAAAAGQAPRAARSSEGEPRTAPESAPLAAPVTSELVAALESAPSAAQIPFEGQDLNWEYGDWVRIWNRSDKA